MQRLMNIGRIPDAGKVIDPKRYSFILSAAIGSCLFGLRHIMAPIRSYYDGTMSCKGFVANAIVNIVHVVSCTGTDEFMVVRITIAQALSFVSILVWYIFVKRKGTKQAGK